MTAEQTDISLCHLLPSSFLSSSLGLLARLRVGFKLPVLQKALFSDRSAREGAYAVRLTGRAIASVVRRYAKKAGLPVDSFSGHSLRAGFVTSAARAGEPERRIMRQTDHKSIEMVLRYVWQANASK